MKCTPLRIIRGIAESFRLMTRFIGIASKPTILLQNPISEQDAALIKMRRDTMWKPGAHPDREFSSVAEASEHRAIVDGRVRVVDCAIEGIPLSSFHSIVESSPEGKLVAGTIDKYKCAMVDGHLLMNDTPFRLDPNTGKLISGCLAENAVVRGLSLAAGHEFNFHPDTHKPLSGYLTHPQKVNGLLLERYFEYDRGTGHLCVGRLARDAMVDGLPLEAYTLIRGDYSSGKVVEAFLSQTTMVDGVRVPAHSSFTRARNRNDFDAPPRITSVFLHPVCKPQKIAGLFVQPSTEVQIDAQGRAIGGRVLNGAFTNRGNVYGVPLLMSEPFTVDPERKCVTSGVVSKSVTVAGVQMKADTRFEYDPTTQQVRCSPVRRSNSYS